MQSNYSKSGTPGKSRPLPPAPTPRPVFAAFPIKGTMANEMGLDGHESLLVWPLCPLERLSYAKPSPGPSCRARCRSRAWG